MYIVGTCTSKYNMSFTKKKHQKGFAQLKNKEEVNNDETAYCDNIKLRTVS